MTNNSLEGYNKKNEKWCVTMLSCDNFALTVPFTAMGSNLHAKNSDRPLGEAQGLRFYPAADYPEGSLLRCTDLVIPQVRHTYAVLGSQPYWIWGFEMGVNECGVSIGNEAQGSKCAKETETGLLGMDLLRLALERGATAREAAGVIVDLLSKYGQNANASQLFDRRYENSYLLMDRNEILVLETAGRQWVMKQIRDWTAISNCYSIRQDFDESSARLEPLAREMRWLSDREPFDFAKAYTLPEDRQKNAVPRWRRMRDLIRCAQKPLSLQAVQAICRDHFDGLINESRFGAFLGTFYSICMHAETPSGSQTVASMITYYEPTLGIICRYAVALPCCSVYLPVYFGGKLPEELENVGAEYDHASLWWTCERLAMAVSVDEARFAPAVRAALMTLEQKLEAQAQAAEEKARAQFPMGREALFALTQEGTKQLRELADRLAGEICDAVNAEGGAYGPRREFLRIYSTRTKMPLFYDFQTAQ